MDARVKPGHDTAGVVRGGVSLIQFSNSPRASTHIQADVIHRPRFWSAWGPPSSSFPHSHEGAERRKALGNIWHLGEGAACHVTGTPTSRRSTVASLAFGTVLTGLGPKGINPLVSRTAFAALVPCPSQPLKAAPRSRDGRRPETARDPVCVTGARAPHLAPSTKTPLADALN